MLHSSLEESDAAAILRLLETLTAAETLDEYAHMTMVGLIELIPCIDASYNEMNPSANRISWASEPQNDAMDEYAPLFARLMRQNPLVRHFEDTADTRAMMWADVASFEDIAQTELYQEMFRPLGVEAQMAMVVPTPPGIVVGFAVNTGVEGFTERDRAVFNTLRPHLAHFYRSIQLREMARQAPGWTGALANGEGIVERVTDNSKLLADDAGIQLAEGEPLPDAINAPFKAGVNGYHPSQPATLSRSTRISEEADGVVGWHVPGPVGPHVVVVQTHADAMGRRLSEAGLTGRQTEVALQLAEGGTNSVIARRLGIAEGTLRKHLERIYRALDVTDRASAIARIRGW
ncbi:MAG: helix-turn-helix transcriptional regulator [Acidimicrobiia bacterium]